jgi:hypothetical protein
MNEPIKDIGEKYLWEASDIVILEIPEKKENIEENENV